MSFRRIFLEDFWLKLFAVAVAVWIYATVRLAESQAESRTFNDLPVLVLSPPGAAGLITVLPERVTVEVRGESSVLRRLDPLEIHPVVDLTAPGALLQRHHRLVISVPPGVTASDVDPDSVLIETEPNSRTTK